VTAYMYVTVDDVLQYAERDDRVDRLDLDVVRRRVDDFGSR
jgi:hypothetical protein